MKLHRTMFDALFAAVVLPSIQRMAKRCYVSGRIEGRQEVAEEFIKGGFIPISQLVNNPEHLRNIENLIQSELSAKQLRAAYSRLGVQRLNEIACRVRAQRLTIEQTTSRESIL